MTEADIEAALKARLRTYFVDLPVVYPNERPTTETSYVVVQITRNPPLDRTVAATSLIRQGIMTATVVVPQGTSVRDATGYAETLAALYPAGLRIAAQGGTITIPRPPHINAYPQGASWRTTVVIPYLAS